jgi:DNA-binding MarR family transcriptional regulator
MKSSAIGETLEVLEAKRAKQLTRKGKTEVPSRVDVTVEEEQNCTAIFHDVMRLRGALTEIAVDTASGLEMKSTEMSILDTLGKFGPLTMGRVAQLSFISPTNSTRAVKNLIADGFVERRRSEHSDREVVVSLTDNGCDVFRESYPRMIHEVNEFLSAGLSDNERSTLADLLAKAIKAAD